ncbi:unnamed protein product [Acanthosepion pharaonis]|uniref:Uncharacterized protein n=1 Tax=Acanthosepion pharaonis TaxID=158019 RepID=A0A812DHE2_ACAPH|nr:unnamed protein product [Sepia pharaonis]
MRSCNDQSSCQIRSPNNVNYVCIKRKFERSTCTQLKPSNPSVTQTGCYIGKNMRHFQISLPKYVTFTVSSLDHGNNSSSKETPKNCLPVDKVIIILVAIVIVLMMINIVLVAFIFYRQKANKTTKAVTTNSTFFLFHSFSSFIFSFILFPSLISRFLFHLFSSLIFFLLYSPSLFSFTHFLLLFFSFSPSPIFSFTHFLLFSISLTFSYFLFHLIFFSYFSRRNKCIFSSPNPKEYLILFFLSDERFIKTANGPKTIHCDHNSFFFTNATKYMRSCNDQSSCQIRSRHYVNYVCIKRKFEKSTCTQLTHHNPNVNQTGCYIGNFTRTFEISLPKTGSKIFHVFVLYKHFFSLSLIFFFYFLVRLFPSLISRFLFTCFHRLSSSFIFSFTFLFPHFLLLFSLSTNLFSYFLFHSLFYFFLSFIFFSFFLLHLFSLPLLLFSLSLIFFFYFFLHSFFLFFSLTFFSFTHFLLFSLSLTFSYFLLHLIFFSYFSRRNKFIFPSPNPKEYFILFFLSDERFIKTANGPKTIHCDQNSFFFTNDTKYMRSCNDQSSCQIRSRHYVNYVCIKRKFEKSTCTQLTRHNPNYVLYADKSNKNIMLPCSAFCYYKCRSPCRIIIDEDSRILFKVSDKSEEDFREFFMEDNPKTTFERKDEAFTVSSLDHGNNSSSKETPKNCLPVHKVIIILVAVVIVLLMINIALVAFIFYRQKANKTTKSVTAKSTYEIPLNENDANDLNTYENLN